MSGARRRRWRIGTAAATLLAALIGAGALLVDDDGSRPGGTTIVSGNSNCNDATIAGTNNRVNCGTDLDETPEPPRTKLRGLPLPVDCEPEGESLVLRAAASVEVRVWCSVLGPRAMVQAKLKVWMSNGSKRAIDVSLSRWALLVPGPKAARRWSAPPGENWPRPRVISLPEGKVTAIPPNPDGEAEILGEIAGGVNYSFATHWKKQSLAPGERWRPPLLDANGARYSDGTLVFYVPLVRHGRSYRQPQIYGLARVQGDRILTLCPTGRWGKRVSAERF